MLERLRSDGKTLGIVSSRRHDEYDSTITPLGIDGYFSTRVLAEDTERHKPSPDPILEYLRRSGAKPEETVYVGDTEYDLLAAGAAGVSFAFASWGAASELEGVSYRAEAPAEVLKLVSVEEL